MLEKESKESISLKITFKTFEVFSGEICQRRSNCQIFFHLIHKYSQIVVEPAHDYSRAPIM